MRETTRQPAIETFLGEVDARLQRLPEARRAAERDELAQHLDLLVSAYRARGMDADAAARAAIERFGRAERIGAELHDAWHRKTREYAGFFAAYAAFIMVAYLGLYWSMGDPMPRRLAWVIAVNATVLPSAFIYADVRAIRAASRVTARARRPAPS